MVKVVNLGTMMEATSLIPELKDYRVTQTHPLAPEAFSLLLTLSPTLTFSPTSYFSIQIRSSKTIYLTITMVQNH